MTRPRFELRVSDCGSCPFAMEPDVTDDGWYCGAIAGHNEAREIATPLAQIHKRRPPRWCPLRRADQLVTLEVKRR